MSSHVNLPKCGSLEIIWAPMFANKSGVLIDKLDKYSTLGKKKVGLVRSGRDTRPFLSRNKTTVKNLSETNIIEITIPVTDEKKLPKIEKKQFDQICALDVAGFDEGHMFDSDRFVEVILSLFYHHKKTIIVAGIDGDYKQGMFTYAIKLTPHVTPGKLTKLDHSLCFECVRIHEKDPNHIINISTVTCMIIPAKIVTTKKTSGSGSDSDDLKSDSPTPTISRSEISGLKSDQPSPSLVKENLADGRQTSDSVLQTKPTKKETNIQPPSKELVLTKYGKDVILPGDKDIYEARCPDHIIIQIPQIQW